MQVDRTSWTLTFIAAAPPNNCATHATDGHILMIAATHSPVTIATGACVPRAEGLGHRRVMAGKPRLGFHTFPRSSLFLCVFATR